jgi:hypothetical protein
MAKKQRVRFQTTAKQDADNARTAEIKNIVFKAMEPLVKEVDEQSRRTNLIGSELAEQSRRTNLIGSELAGVVGRVDGLARSVAGLLKTARDRENLAPSATEATETAAAEVESSLYYLRKALARLEKA